MIGFDVLDPTISSILLRIFNKVKFNSFYLHYLSYCIYLLVAL